MIRHTLFISGDASASDLFRATIESASQSVTTASSGHKGLEHFASGHFHIVAVDQDLSDMAGLDVCRELLKQSPGLPIIIIINHKDADLAAEALYLGVAYFLEKDSPEIFSKMLPGIFRQLERRMSDQNTPEEAREDAHRYRELISGIAGQAKLGLWELDETTQTETYLSPEFAHHLQMIQSTSNSLGQADMDDERQRGVHPEDWDRYLEETQNQAQNQGVVGH